MSGRTPASRARWTALLSTALALVGCHRADSGERVGVARAALTGTDVLGFEDASGWSTTTTGATLVRSTSHDQGSFSLELHPSSSNGNAPITSVALGKPSTVSQKLAFDILLPTQQPNPSWYGTAQIYLNCPSRNVSNAFLAQIELTGKPLNTWTTLTFPVADAVLAQLLNAGYSDLKVTVVVNVPVPTTGVYRLDNLRFIAAKPSECPGRPNGTSCDDSNLCTAGETCQAGQCKQGSTVTCTTDTCHTIGACAPATGCPAPIAKANGTSCNDSNACTRTDTCQSGVCTGANSVTCTAADACHVVGTCDRSTGTCSQPNAPDGTTCSDGNACTQPDSCQSGICSGQGAADCVVTPRFEGIASVGGVNQAVFSYVNSSKENVHIPYGADNSLSDASGVLPAPPVAVPEWFLSADHPGALVVPMTTNTLTWTIRRLSATASLAGPTLPTRDTPRGPVADLPAGAQISLGFDPSYGLAPTDTIAARLTVGKTDGAFAVTADGASSYDIPLWVSPGRGGFTPSLALSYNSRSGPGHFGVGWNLDGTSQIAHCNKNVATDQVSSIPKFAAGDALCLDGNRLLLVSGSGGDGSEYWEMESSFSRVHQHGDLGSSVTFEVQHRDGSVAIYGGGNATVNPPSLVPVVLPKHELAWSVASERDRAGNVIQYSYVQRIAGDQDSLLLDKPEYLLDRIDYVFAGTSQTTPTRTVRFAYEPLAKQLHRLQWQVPMPLRSRVKTVQVLGPNPSSPGVLREYRLAYTTGALSGRDVLASVTECEGPNGVCKRPTQFYYSDDSSPQYELHAGSFPEISYDVQPTCCNGYDNSCCNQNTSQRNDALVADLNGDGLDDVIYSFNDYIFHSIDLGTDFPGPSHFVCRLSDGHGLGPEIDLSNVLLGNAMWPLYVADLNGDGKTDVLAEVGDTNLLGPGTYYAFYSTTERTTPGGGVSPDVRFTRSATPVLVIQSNYNAHGEVYKTHPYFADVDGDGLVDVLQGNAPMDPNDDDKRLPQEWQIMRGRPDGSLGAPIHGLTANSGFVEAPNQFPHETVLATRLMQQAGMQFLIPTQSHVEDHGNGNLSAWNDLSTLAVDFHGSVSVSNPSFSDDILLAPLMLDVTGDGLPEVVKVSTLFRGVACTETAQGCVEEQRVHGIFFDRNIGAGFLQDQDTGLQTHWVDAGLNAWHMDYNEDGADDLVLLRELRDNAILTDWGARKLAVFESSQVGLKAPHPLFSAGTNASNRIYSLYRENAVNYSVGRGGVNPYPGGHVHNATPLDVNGDGLTDILVGPNVYVRQGGRVDLLTGVVDGVGHDILVKYRSLGDRDPIDAKNEIPSSKQIPFYSRTEECSYPLFGADKGVWAVAEVDVDDGTLPRDEDPQNCAACGRSGSGSYNRFLYGYENGRVSITNGEWLGFTKRTILDVTRGMTTVTMYDTAAKVGSDFYWGRFKPGAEEVSIDLPAHDSTVHANEAVRYSKITNFDYTVMFPLDFRTDIVAVLPSHVAIDESDTGARIRPIRHIEKTFDYDEFGNLKTATEAYELGETVVRETQYENRNTTSQWLLGLPTHVTETSTPVNGDAPVTRTTAYTYDTAGQLATETIEPDGDNSLFLETTFERDAFGNVTAMTANDSQGSARRTEFTYDSDGVYRIRERNALGHVSQTVYHAGYGTPVFTTDPNGAVEAFRFDRFGRPKAGEHADGSFESLAYARGPTVSISTSDNHFSSSTFDRLGRAVQHQSRAFDGRLTSATKSYSRLGQLASATLPAFSGEQPRSTFTFGHDARDRLTMKRVTDNQNVVVADSFEFYDGLDQLSVDAIVSTEEGVVRPVRLVTTDDHDRAIRAVDYKDSSESAGVATTYTYGAFGVARNVQTAAPTGPTLQAVYDQRGRVISRSDSDSGTTHYGFDAWGERISLTDAKQQTTTSDRDALGRVFAEHSPIGESSFDWDSAPFGVGRLASSASEDGAGDSESGRVYDVAGHVLRESYLVHGEPFVIDYAYNQTGPQIGKLAVVSYPPIPGRTDPVMVETRYGSNGDVSALAPPGSGGTYFQVVAKDASSRITEELFGADVQRTRGYDPLFGGLATAHAVRQGTILQDLNVAYDFRGNVMSRVDTAPGLGSLGVAETFDYDALARLRYWTSNTGVFSVEYQYDDIGNLTQRQVTQRGAAGIPEVYGYGESGAGPHQLTSAPWGTYQYDANGDQTQAPGRTAAFAPFHLPLSVTTPSQSDHFEYDALHQRTFKSSSGSTTTYAGSEYERRRDAQGIHHVIHLRLGGRELAALQVDETAPSASPAVTYLLDDHLGSPVVVLDPAGNVTRPRYEPFGQRLADGDVPASGSSGNPAVHFGLTGHEYDDDIGLINMKGRLYDPRIRRFLSPDPLVDDPLSSQAFNRYSYVANNPLSRTDPTGFTANANAGSSVNYQFSQNSNPGQTETGDANSVSVSPGATDDFGTTGGCAVTDPKHKSHITCNVTIKGPAKPAPAAAAAAAPAAAAPAATGPSTTEPPTEPPPTEPPPVSTERQDMYLGAVDGHGGGAGGMGGHFDTRSAIRDVTNAAGTVDDASAVGKATSEGHIKLGKQRTDRSMRNAQITNGRQWMRRFNAIGTVANWISDMGNMAILLDPESTPDEVAEAFGNLVGDVAGKFAEPVSGPLGAKAAEKVVGKGAESYLKMQMKAAEGLCITCGAEGGPMLWGP
jgi:RHS repeat-associated protein